MHSSDSGMAFRRLRVICSPHSLHSPNSGSSIFFRFARAKLTKKKGLQRIRCNPKDYGPRLTAPHVFRKKFYVKRWVLARKKNEMAVVCLPFGGHLLFRHGQRHGGHGSDQQPGRCRFDRCWSRDRNPPAVKSNPHSLFMWVLTTCSPVPLSLRHVAFIAKGGSFILVFR